LLFDYILKCSCDGKAVFSASLLQVSVLHGPSEMILICWFVGQETLLIINVKNTVSYFVETLISRIYFQDSLINRKHLFLNINLLWNCQCLYCLFW